ncbi:5357_t:CDS:10 [Rhizophagus irregularis]|nr:5357_t:CDS:10 [Rhizophagus irregularis]
MDLSTLYSHRLLNRKIKVHPQKYTENYIENVETNKTISNTRPTNFLSLNEQHKSSYLSYEEIVFPSRSSSLKQYRQENKNVSSCDSLNNSITPRLEENINIRQQQKDLSERVAVSNDTTPPKVAQKDQKKNLFEEIKKICFKLMGKIDVFKIMTRNRIVKDHWKEDNTTKCCSFCNRKFTIFFRKHHCRICGNIYCSSCSSGRTLLDPILAIPAQYVAVTTSNKNVKYNRNSGGFEFDGFEYNYLDYEEFDQEQEQRHYGDMSEYSVTNCSDYNSDSSSLVDLNNCTCDMIYNDDDSLTVNDNDDINYVSEPVRERICINCHKIFELDERDWPRKVLFRKATKQDPIIVRIELLEEFDNIMLAVNEIEEFHDVQYESPKVDSFSQTKSFPNPFVEEISTPIIKLPKTRFLTCAVKNFKLHGYSNSSLTDIESHLNNSSYLSSENEIFLTNTITDSQDLGEISSPIVKLPKSYFLTYAINNSSVSTSSNSTLTDTISNPQEIELQLDTTSIQNEIYLTSSVIDLQEFEVTTPIVRLPKTQFFTYTAANSSVIETHTTHADNSFLSNIISEPQDQLNVSSSNSPRNEIQLITTIDSQDSQDSQDFEKISSPIVKLPKTRFSACAITNSSTSETPTSNLSLVDINSETQDVDLQLNGFSSNFQNGTNTTDNLQDDELQLKDDEHLTTSSDSFSQTSEEQTVKSSLYESIVKEENVLDNHQGKNVLTPYLTSLYNHQVHSSYGYYNPINNYVGYGLYYDSSFGGYYQPQYQSIESNYPIKKGDWFCNKCFQHNFAKRNRCYFCQKSSSKVPKNEENDKNDDINDINVSTNDKTINNKKDDDDIIKQMEKIIENYSKFFTIGKLNKDVIIDYYKKNGNFNTKGIDPYEIGIPVVFKSLDNSSDISEDFLYEWETWLKDEEKRKPVPENESEVIYHPEAYYISRKIDYTNKINEILAQNELSDKIEILDDNIDDNDSLEILDKLEYLPISSEF